MTFANIPLDKITTHPNNPRWHVEADEEMVASIVSVGILTPVTVAPGADDTFVLIGGHRRLDGARKADLTQVPAVIRGDLLTDAQQLEAMLVENLQRLDLTVVEEAAAYTQLELFGMDATAIAKATGRKVSTIRSRMKLAGLSESARTSLHTGDITLTDATSLLEFADDPELLAELEEKIGTSGNFQYDLNIARGQRERRARNQDLLDEFDGYGATLIEEARWSMKDGPCPLTWLDDKYELPSQHDGCLAYFSSGLDSYSTPFLVCTTPANHPTEAKASSTGSDEVRVNRQSEWEKKQGERLAREERADAASAARVGFLVDHLTAALAPKSKTAAYALLQVAAPAMISYLSEFVPPKTVLRAAGQEVPDPQALYTALETYVASAGESPAAGFRAYVGWVAAAVDTLLGEDLTYTDAIPEVDRQLALWDWLEAAGYSFSEHDKAQRDWSTARLGELIDATDSEAS